MTAALVDRPAGVESGSSDRTGPLLLDDVQAGVVEHRGPVLVLGAPGTGKSTTVVAWVERRLASARRDGPPPMLLAPTRRAARRLDGLVGRRAGRITDGAVVRTPHSLAWAVLRERAARDGAPAPRLVTGGEADIALVEMLAVPEPGGRADVVGPDWPDTVPPAVRATAAFRADLRELWSRVVERGLGPEDLADLGRRRGRPEWQAAAALLRERTDIAGLRGDNAWDPAEIVDEAAAVLDSDPSLAEWVRARVGALAVDDAQDLTAAAWRLVRAVAAPGADAVVTADPDLATQGFRGGRPTLLVEAAASLTAADGTPAATVVLPTAWRHGPDLAAVCRVVAERVGAVTARHRRPALPTAAPTGSAPRLLRCADASHEAAVVADLLREHRHSPRDPLAWDRMAVVVRSRARAAAVRVACRHAGIPVETPGTSRALRDEPAVAVLLRAAAVVADPGVLDGDGLRTLTLGPLGEGDPTAWRRLLSAASAACPGADPVSTLVAAVRERVVAGPSAAGRAESEPTESEPTAPWPGAAAAWRPVRRLLDCLRAACRAVWDGPDGVAGAAPSAAAVLWAVWSASGLAERWREQALSGGPAAAAADDDLDAVLALFDAVTGLEERTGPVPFPAFAARVQAAGVRDDDLAGRADRGPAVVVTTPAGAAGHEWDLVVVAGVQDGAWPDVRVRGSVLATAELVDVLDGRHPSGPGAAVVDHRRETLDDELRLFLVAVSRARRHLVVTAVDGDDQRPSWLCRLVAAPDGSQRADEGPDVPGLDVPGGDGPAWHGHRLDGVVAALRRVLLGRPGHLPGGWAELDPRDAARLLARLADAGVPGAHPGTWAWASPATAPGPRLPSPADVLVSPSQVERFHTCPLQWYLTRVAGPGPVELPRRLGTLVHEAAQRRPAGSAEELWAEVEAGWDRLGPMTPWVDERERRRARLMVERLAGWLAARPDMASVDTEVAVDVEVAGVRLRGAIDRLETLPDGRTRVVDLKTGPPVTAAEAAANPQLAAYQMAVETQGATSAGACLVHVGGPSQSAAERGQDPLSDEGRAGVAALLTTAAHGMAGERFPARPGRHCERCPVRAACPATPEGRRPGPVGGDR